MTETEVQKFLDAPHTGVLATLGRDGHPHLSGMWFVPSGRSVRMWTYAKSQKAVNMRRDPRASFLVEDGTGYEELMGVSLRGRARVLTEPDEVRAIGIALFQRYTAPRLGLALDDDVLSEIERQTGKRVGFELTAESIASWDHSKLS